ncbi:MAG: hypothetical protein GXP62_05140 [Oligoflexia bacterium]|nr:hypothetical protein [Oligoflexia bacterium]
MLLLATTTAAAAPPSVVVEISCEGLARSRHALIVSSSSGRELASAIVPRSATGHLQVVLNPTGIPARVDLVGAECTLHADVTGPLDKPFHVWLSDGEPPPPVPVATTPVDDAMALTSLELRTPELLGRLLVQARAEPPGNAAEELLSRVPRLEGHPFDPRIAAQLPDGRTVTALVGPSCPCGQVPANTRASVTVVDEVAVVSAHAGPFLALILPPASPVIGQILCGCVPVPPLWVDDDLALQERNEARKLRK